MRSTRDLAVLLGDEVHATPRMILDHVLYRLLFGSAREIEACAPATCRVICDTTYMSVQALIGRRGFLTLSRLHVVE